ncbi:MAG: B12-binding domain-containing radical SAM protein [Desulfobacterales bacterium]|nr:MAG: B12-binding domain-containing radical SAM protein [Desulfobacterales bacterium]
MSNKLKIKIVEPYYLDKRYDVRALTPNLGPITVASLLKHEGHEVEVISEYVTKLDIEEVNRADLVGISINTYNAPRGYEIAGDIKKPIVFGGFHASLMPEECLDYGDYVIRGDGHAIVELADYLANKGENEITEIPNLVYRKNGKVVRNRNESNAINIVPDFSLVKDYHRLNLNRLLRIPLLVNASRGCNFECTFCSIKEIYKDFQKKDIEVITASVRSVLKDQHFLARFLSNGIWITDDNFFTDKVWAKQVLQALSELQTKIKFVIQARIDIAHDDELLDLMRKANFGRVYLGIESLSEESLRSFNKDYANEDVAYAIQKIISHGMEVHGLFVFGDDAFAKGDGLKVAEFAIRQKLSGVLIQPQIPFPGTKLYKRLKKEGRILHEDWQHYNGKVVFEPKNLAAAELQAEVYACYKKVYSFFRTIKLFLSVKKGFKFGALGESLMRHLEGSKRKNYIKDKLT